MVARRTSAPPLHGALPVLEIDVQSVIDVVRRDK